MCFNSDILKYLSSVWPLKCLKVQPHRRNHRLCRVLSFLVLVFHCLKLVLPTSRKTSGAGRSRPCCCLISRRRSVPCPSMGPPYALMLPRFQSTSGCMGHTASQCFTSQRASRALSSLWCTTTGTEPDPLIPGIRSAHSTVSFWCFWRFDLSKSFAAPSSLGGMRSEP
jgi:hypothetical protein